MTKIIKWISAKEDILSSYPECNFDELHEDVLIAELIDKGYIIYGDTHQSYDHTCVPVFDDGYMFLSMRVWSKIMATAMNICNINKEKRYDYMDFYMVSIGKIKEKLPE